MARGAGRWAWSLAAAGPSVLSGGGSVLSAAAAGVTTTAWPGISDVRPAGMKARQAAFHRADLGVVRVLTERGPSMHRLGCTA